MYDVENQNKITDNNIDKKKSQNKVVCIINEKQNNAQNSILHKKKKN